MTREQMGGVAQSAHGFRRSTDRPESLRGYGATLILSQPIPR